MKSDTLRFCLFAVLVVLFSFSITACPQKTVKVDPAETMEVEEPAATDDQMANQGKGPDESLDSQPIVEEVEEALEGRTSRGLLPVYFDFDQSSLRSDQIQRLQGNAAFIKSNPGIKVRIEGNCDERGSNEYNMALGDRRAVGAKKYLLNLGVSAASLDTISYGEEQPLNFGHSELSWSQNRRDDFVIVK